jgi:integrase
MPTQEKEEIQPPTAKQFLAILEKTRKKIQRLALITMERCALEPGVISTLTWGDVDVAESKFRLQRKNVKGQRTVRARLVNVPRWLMDLIEQSCPWEDRTPDRPVFGGNPDQYGYVMRQACKLAKIPHFTPYNLRHRRISLWNYEGIPWVEIMSRSGHSKKSTTLDVYSHVLLDPTEATDEELQALLVSV